MEILSTGEKIKRARVYNGITLKELCGDKISISKMSCIENGKVKADNATIKFIAEKIGIEYEYIVHDVYEQITTNLAVIKDSTSKDKNIEENIKHNLEYAVDYEYYELAFELIHILFSYYLKEEKYEKIQLIVSQYYDLYQKDNKEENTIIYFSDMAKYLLQNNEYNEAIAYYSRLRDVIKVNSDAEKSTYSNIAYYEGICYCSINQLDKGYELLSQAVKYSDAIDDITIRGRIFKQYALVCILLKNSQAEEYIEKTFKCQKDDPTLVATAKGEYGKAYFTAGEYDRAIMEITDGINIFPQHDKEKYVEFLNECIYTLYKNRQYDKAYELIGHALNLAIETGDIRLIERDYYFKGSILQKQGKYIEAEMYMNISLDSILKFGTTEQRNQRYLDMANMYYNLGDVQDSIKYFSLAMNKDKLI
ncbi:helix-turn-helix domain-containing protein [Clostridium vincentii]|uniref:Anaphase-promoting complex, cyclosome, subunit 3 n=1 Tax=Clostridium vincentii TaxID=52704 RepID=A0A2T0BEV6_9CLOT|nr:helix-turn-helix transcriptional regulator [Clostridium vincentii]PRR82347.1 Anaphase-promoting complex, cyclosome, subunit 3 [Clostridium vincentii]